MRTFKYKVIFTVVLLSNSIFGQQVTTGEYFFNNDPGLGNGTSFAISETSGEFTKVIDALVTNLPIGFNTFYVRAKQNTNWSMFERSLFYKIDPNINFTEDVSIKNLKYAEYFLDIDPGLGSGTSISITKEKEINITFSLDISSLTQGFHTIYIRTKNEDDKWSTFDRSLFYISDKFEGTFSDSPIVKAEYFFDSDPGLDKGLGITLDASGKEINQTFSVDISNLIAGFHTVYFRGKNENNEWSMFERSLFYISSDYSQLEESPMVAAEYYFNEFMDFGTGTSIPLVTNSEGDFETDINTGSLTEGEHLLFIRSKNEANVWSLYDVVTFTIDTVLGIDKVLSKDFIIYPNVVKDIINIESQHAILSYQIYDVKGEIIQKNKLSNNNVDATGLTAGFYFLILKTEKGTVVKKIVKD
jgi:hypothetical protein